MMFRFFGVVETVAILAIMNLAELFLAWRVWAMARRALPWNASELARVHDDIRGNLERGNLSDVDPTSQCLELHTLGKGEIPLDAQGGRQDIAVTRQSV